MLEKNVACIFNIQRFSIHDGPGIRTTVFFKGCPLKCEWCANPESQRFKPEIMWKDLPDKQCVSGDIMSINAIMLEILKDRDYYQESGGGVTLSGGEFLYQSSAAVNLLKNCKMYNIHTACETSGYADNRIFKYVMDHVDLIILDIKHYDRVKHREFTGVYPDKIFRNLEYVLKTEKEVLIRVPVIPGFNNSPDDAIGFCKFLRDYNITTVELIPFHQLGRNKYSALARNYKYANRHSLSIHELNEFKMIMVEHGVNCI